MTDTATLEKVLDALVDNGITVRDYLRRLLLTLWEELEGFSGKRPFGNSGWEYDLYIAIANAGLIEAEIDEEGCLDYMSDEEEKKAHQLIQEAIHYVFRKEPHAKPND